MAKTVIGAAALALGVAASAHAMALTLAQPAELSVPARQNGVQENVRYLCRCARQFPPRQYWRWDASPIWDDPWTVLRPNFWGSPEPHLVPADIWAAEWHPVSPWKRHWQRRWHVRHHRISEK